MDRTSHEWGREAGAPWMEIRKQLIRKDGLFLMSVLHQTVSEDSLMNQTVSGNPLSAQRHCLFHPVYSGKVILYLYIDLSSAEASKNQIVLPIVIHESVLHLDIKRFIFHA